MSYLSNLIGMVLIGLLLLGCQENVEEKTTNSTIPPNIVWINTEDISPALDCYGETFAITPNIDKMTASGLVYRNSSATFTSWALEVAQEQLESELYRW